MERIINKIATRYVLQGVIEESDYAWFVYGLEKRISSFIGTLFFFILAISISDFWTSLSFFVSFCSLRTRTNGFHAKSFLGCLTISLILEFLFLDVILPVLSPLLAFELSLLAFTLIFLFAPYNHPNMHMDTEEILAVRASARVRITVFTLLIPIFYLLGMQSIGNGLVLGNAMTGFLLVIEIIKEGDWRHETRIEQKEDHHPKRSKSNDQKGFL